MNELLYKLTKWLDAIDLDKLSGVGLKTSTGRSFPMASSPTDVPIAHQSRDILVHSVLPFKLAKKITSSLLLHAS